MSNSQDPIFKNLQELTDQLTKLDQECTRHAAFDPQLTARRQDILLERQFDLSEAIFKDRFLEQAPKATHAQTLIALFRFRDLKHDLHEADHRLNQNLINQKENAALRSEAILRFHDGLQVPHLFVQDLAR